MVVVELDRAVESTAAFAEVDEVVEIVAVVGVQDSAVTTSGNYEQYYKLENKKLSHIIDPRTGYPQAGVISSTIIADNALEADVFSTALSVLGVEEGLTLIKGLGGNKASLLFTDSSKDGILKRFESDNFAQYLIQQ